MVVFLVLVILAALAAATRMATLPPGQAVKSSCLILAIVLVLAGIKRLAGLNFESLAMSVAVFVLAVLGTTELIALANRVGRLSPEQQVAIDLQRRSTAEKARLEANKRAFDAQFGHNPQSKSERRRSRKL